MTTLLEDQKMLQHEIHDEMCIRDSTTTITILIYNHKRKAEEKNEIFMQPASARKSI